MGVSDEGTAMKNADRINFYLAGLRQPGDRRLPAAPAAAEAPADAAKTESAKAEPVKSETAADEPASAQKGLPAARAESLAKAMQLPADSRSFAAALRAQLAEEGERALPATLDQAQLRRLLERLDKHRDRFESGMSLSPEGARKRQRRLILGLLLAAGIIALQATAVIWLYQRAELLLGRPLSPALLMTATGADLDVVFRPSASAGDIAVLLRELDLHMVDGPDNGSRYVLRPEAGTDGKRALNALRDRRDLVYSAEAAY